MDAAPTGELSAREIEILGRVATGATNQQIAVDLDISVNTVKAHLRNIFGKLGVESRTEATLYALQHGLVALPGAAIAQAVSAPTGVPAEGPAGAVAAPAPPDAPPSWPLRWPQQVVVWLVVLAVVLAVAWPQGRGGAPVPRGRLVDLPAPAAPQLETVTASRWELRAQLPIPRGRLALAEWSGRIYAIAGLTAEGWSGRVDAYDPASDAWTRQADKPTPVANVGAAAIDGRIYVPGGLLADNTPSDRLEVYDPASDQWSEGPPLPEPLCAYAIAAHGQEFFLFGGWDGARYVDAVYAYDAPSATWRRAGQLRAARGFAAAAPLGERIYLLGGYDGQDELAHCESFSPSALAAGAEPWLTHSPMRAGRAGHGAAVVDGSLYVVGGGWAQPLTYNERYDARNDVWSTFQSPITGEWRTLGLATLATPSGAVLYAIGGWSGGYLSAVHRYQATYRVFVP
ncbi:MAG: kelch repeat-containing protein [Chloroflexota bacterium]